MELVNSSKIRVVNARCQPEIEKKSYQKVRAAEEFISLKGELNGIKLTHYYKSAMNYLKGQAYNR